MGLNTEAMGLENEDFDEDQCQYMYTCTSSPHIFSSYNVSTYSYFSKDDQEI